MKTKNRKKSKRKRQIKRELIIYTTYYCGFSSGGTAALRLCLLSEGTSVALCLRLRSMFIFFFFFFRKKRIKKKTGGMGRKKYFEKKLGKKGGGGWG